MATTEKILVDLSGPDGNAMQLMASAKRWAKQMEIDSAPIIKEMMQATSYEHLMSIVERHFGQVVELINGPSSVADDEDEEEGDDEDDLDDDDDDLDDEFEDDDTDDDLEDTEEEIEPPDYA